VLLDDAVVTVLQQRMRWFFPFCVDSWGNEDCLSFID